MKLILLAIVLVYITICLLRAKLDKKFVVSNKFFYTVLGIGVTLISIIGSMYIGYNNFGDPERLKKYWVQSHLLLVIGSACMYSILVSTIFNLDSMKKNIIKILVTLVTFPIIIFMSSTGLLLAIEGNISNLLIVAILLIIALTLLLLSYKIANEKIKLILYSLGTICIIAFCVFLSDLFFQNKYVLNIKEFLSNHNILQYGLDSVIGEGNWEISNLRKGEIDYSSFGEGNLDCTGLEINYFDGTEMKNIRREVKDDEIKYVPLFIQSEKIEEVLSPNMRLYYKETIKSKLIETFVQFRTINLTVSNFSLSNFLDIMADDVYVEYINMTSDEVRQIVGDKVEIRQLNIVPDVSNVNLDIAKKTLEDNGIMYTISEEFSNIYPKGYVIWTIPHKGAVISPDETISVLVSSGPEKYY